ncbi:MAG: hypothetical protein ACYTDW_01340 [Planctomycetota bacterium]
MRVRIQKRKLVGFEKEFLKDLVQAGREGFAFEGTWHREGFTVHWAVEVLPKGKSGFDPVWNDDRTWQSYIEDEHGSVKP